MAALDKLLLATTVISLAVLQLASSQEAIVCEPLPGIDNGMVSYSTTGSPNFGLGTVATYSCEPGFILNITEGSETRECEDDDGLDSIGVFNSEAPNCIRYLPYISLGSGTATMSDEVGHFDDGVSQVISIPGAGLPFGFTQHNRVYVGTNGYLAFGVPFYNSFPERFGGSDETSDVANAYLVAPFWDDIDIRRNGAITFETHDSASSPDLLSDVSRLISNRIGESFSGTWLLVANWELVNSWPDGESDATQSLWALFGFTAQYNNTFQAVVVTDGLRSYAVFIYRCGDINWTDYGATIGFNAPGSHFENHPLTESVFLSAADVDCNPETVSDWNNLVYTLSNDAIGTLAPPPTVEPPQAMYLEYLESGANVLDPCRNCSSPAIPLGTPGLPFGGYYHSTLYVGNNGIFSFGEPWTLTSPAVWPTESVDTHFTWAVSPFWSDIDTRLEGEVRWQTYVSSDTSDLVLLNQVRDYINSEGNSFTSPTWMVVATWSNVHPFPHGESEEQDRQDPYLQRTNKFQGIIITNGVQSFSVFTFNCSDIEWSDSATVGYNAGGGLFDNHPLSGSPESKVIGCVHTMADTPSLWNNVLFDLTTVPTETGNTPAPGNSVGSCREAGYDSCCGSGDFSGCLGHIEDCFCDILCVNFGDCCADQPDICHTTVETSNTTYILYADNFYIGILGLDGASNTLPLNILQGASAIDYDFMRGYLYWFDYVENAIFRSFLNGTEPVMIINTTQFGTVEDIAFDWVSNKLYFTETIHRRIDVFDVENGVIVPVLDAAPNSGVRGIAVDPIDRMMYWTDWGSPAMIESASMDGSNRQTLHNTNIGQPNGITVDYTANPKTIYWTDSETDTIEYSSVEGVGRQTLQSGLGHPYGIAVEGNLVFFTDWDNVGIHMTHKLNDDGFSTFTDVFTVQPAGIQAVAAGRQPAGTDYCSNSPCAHVCLLSSSASGYSCFCRDGYELLADGFSCDFTGTDPPPLEGSCSSAGFGGCCDGGFCAGSPPTCFCDMGCHAIGDCCSDIELTCAIPPSSCASAGYDTCCTDFDCVGDWTAAPCYCDDSCHAFGDCCDDIETTCPGPTTAPTIDTPTLPPTDDTSVLEYFVLNTTAGVLTESIGHFDDGVSHALHIPQGLPFGDQLHTFAFISTNGIISFGQPFYLIPSGLFPGTSTTVSGSYLVAPFWSDVDIRDTGNIRYEVHSGTVADSQVLDTVSEFVNNKTTGSFSGTWALLVSWEGVTPWPNGLVAEDQFWTIFYPDYADTNSYQAVIITDGTDSYALFTYRCGDMQWARGGVIGYNVPGAFVNHPLSGQTGTPDIACSNNDVSEWTNVVYQLAVTDLSTAQPPTVEPAQASYLPMLDFTEGGATTLAPCRNCTSAAIDIPLFPFGAYFQTTAYVATKGLISFNRPFRQESPVAFPAEDDLLISSSYLVAPYWSNIDTRLDGSVSYQVFQDTDANVGDRFTMVNQFLNSETNPDFTGDWMLVVTWSNVHPFPHGESEEQDRQDPYLQSTNTFQAVLVSNGTKAYSVFTYVCDTMQWSDESTIGFNAAGDGYMLHPLSGLFQASAIDCVHSPGSAINNVVYDLAPTPPTDTIPPPVMNVEVPFIVGQTEGVTTQLVPPSDDGTSASIPINLTPGFPFANSYQTEVYVVTNGVISFGPEPLTFHIPFSFPTSFPEIYTKYVITPFWADADLSFRGEIRYEVHEASSGLSDDAFDVVNEYVRNKTGNEFSGTWMLAVLWDDIPQYGDIFTSNGNTFQGIAITDGQDSYAVYSYKCQEMDWSGQAVIGYNGGSPTQYYAVHPLSGSDDAQSIACLEFPNSEWSNVWYKVSIEEVTTVAPPVTEEPGQSQYLQFIDKTGGEEVLPSCDDCHSNSISVPGIPFGSYRHTRAYVSTNGIISFGEEFLGTTGVLYPSTIAQIHFAYTIAPYWADIDTRFQGEVWSEVHVSGGNRVSEDLLANVTSFVRSQTGNTGFTGTWMLVAKWDAVRMYSGATENFNSDENTFQAVIISDINSKTYVIFTYMCDLLTWSEEATIGFNAGGGFFFNHNLAGTTQSHAIDCVHINTDGSVWNNVVRDLVPGSFVDGPTPETPVSFGSCVEQGFSDCCTDFDCTGSGPGDCFCDSSCHQFGDCCHDIEEICSISPPPGQLNTTLLVAAQFNLLKLDGSTVENLLINDFNSIYIALDYDYRNGYIYYSDVGNDEISRTNWDGSSREVLVDTGLENVDGLAVDWVNNKLYWTDATVRVIQVYDISTEARSTLVEFHSESAPRAIVVDPANRMMYWTDWGSPAMIESASMDGSNRQTLHNTGLIWPNGLVLDLPAQRLYWADASLDRIEYSNVDGSGRTVLESADTGVGHPFGVTIDGNVIYWTDWSSDSVYSAHKLLGTTVVPVYESAFFIPSGIEAVNENRQPMAANPCDDQNCGHMCVLSNTSVAGYSCLCPPGEQLLDNGIDCTTDSTPSPTLPPVTDGSCAAAGHTGCCSGGFCIGFPSTANCYCDYTCAVFGDCCSDYVSQNQPVAATDLSVSAITSTAFNVSWTFPSNLQLCQDSFFVVEVFSLATGGSVFFDRLDVDNRYRLVDTGVARWVPYNITLVAGNVLGEVPALFEVAFTEEGVPTVAPGNVMIDRVSSTMMTVSWEPLTLAQAQGFISSYTVSYSPAPEVGVNTKRQANSVDVTDATASIDGLTPGVSYDVTVLANTAQGSGPVSDLSTSAPGTPMASVSPGGVTVGVIVAVVVVILVVAVAVVGAIFIFRKRTKTASEEYAMFSNDQVNLSRTPSVNNPSPAAAFESDIVKPISYKVLDESQRDFDNPNYETVRKTEVDPGYAPVGGLSSQAPPGYSDVTGVAKIPVDPLPTETGPAETGYEPVGELVPGEETKEDLGNSEKKDWTTFGDEV